MKLSTDRELADLLNIPVGKVHELRKRHQWPHIRLGRSEFRFTDEQIRDIVASHTVTGSPALKGTAAGLTSRSAARSA